MGSEPELGSWDPTAVPLNKNPNGKWQIDLDSFSIDKTIEISENMDVQELENH